MRIALFSVVLGMGAIVQAQFGEMLSPRYYLAGSQDGGKLVARDGECPEPNSHPCGELGANATSVCCSNTQYCITDKNLQPACCALNSNCDSPCPTTAYACPTVITVSGTTTTSTACCPRSCPTSTAYKCAASLGGGCCNYNSNCVSAGSTGNCVAVPSTTSRTIVSAIPSGCTTNQYACATGLGGGCCDNGQICTVMSNTNYCAFATGTGILTRTGPGGVLATITVEGQGGGGGGLSTGAKAGIGVGVSLGAFAIIGVFLYFCLIHRRHAHSQSASQPAPSQTATSQVAGSQIAGSQVSRSAAVPNGSNADSKARSKAGSGRPAPTRQVTQPSDYFGPTATAGPFTEEGVHDYTTQATSPGYVTAQGSPHERGVAATPQSPGDIVTPVEIDSKEQSNVNTPSQFINTATGGGTRGQQEPRRQESVEHRVELP